MVSAEASTAQNSHSRCFENHDIPVQYDRRREKACMLQRAAALLCCCVSW